jgi:hypothetical protein
VEPVLPFRCSNLFGSGSAGLDVSSAALSATSQVPPIAFLQSIPKKFNWTEITITLGELGNPESIDRLSFQNNSVSAIGTVSFDHIRLEPPPAMLPQHHADHDEAGAKAFSGARVIMITSPCLEVHGFRAVILDLHRCLYKMSYRSKQGARLDKLQEG